MDIYIENDLVGYFNMQYYVSTENYLADANLYSFSFRCAPVCVFLCRECVEKVRLEGGNATEKEEILIIYNINQRCIVCKFYLVAGNSILLRFVVVVNIFM